MRRRREGQPPSRAERQRWLTGTAAVLYARAYALYVARRSAGVACQLCGHAGARAAIGDHRLIEGPHRGTCDVRCYARRVDVDYRIAALGLDGGWQPCLSEATRRAVGRRLFALVEAHEAATGAPGGAPEPRAVTATAWPVTARWPCCDPPGATALLETPAPAEGLTRVPIAPGTTVAAATN